MRHFDHVIDVHCILTVEKLQHKAEATVRMSGASIHADASRRRHVRGHRRAGRQARPQVVAHKEKLRDRRPRETARHRSRALRRALIAGRRAERERPAPCRASMSSMRLIIVSGLSGSGKSVALHMLEDLDFYCVDNIPAALLQGLHLAHGAHQRDLVPPTAVGLDARNRPARSPRCRAGRELRKTGIGCELLFLRADDETLLQALRRDAPQASAEPRQRGPARGASRWSAPARSDREGGRPRHRHLAPGVHELRELIRKRVVERAQVRRCRSCSSPSATSTACPATPTSCSTRAPCPIRTGSRRCAT